MSKGFDNLQINHHLDLALPFNEAVGAVAFDRSTHQYPFALHGAPTWVTLASGLSVLDFDPANPDWLDCAGAVTVDLDYTSENFSLAAWVNLADLTANRTVICRGLLVNDGWYYQVLINGSIILVTNQAAGSQYTSSIAGTVVTGAWALMGASRDGATVRFYKNGEECTYSLVGTHIDPLTSARETHIGIYDDETAAPWSHYMRGLRSWGGRALSRADHKYLFATERHWFDV